ncbi:M56 family metallopeptidase [Brassicibacter mesophilus]|uniref:M56 family metallopeptidase n=1 Tax=Brassicibacter mesophilus TaxID=745119 RepID=UPI003D1971DF
MIDSNTLEIYNKVCVAAGIKKPLALFTNKLATSPMLVGIVHPFIVLPNTEIDDEELYNIFLHELTHYKRLDILYKWLTQIAICIHWFNPFAYMISHEINKNCELSCDEAIIKNLDYNGKRKYGDTLLASLKFSGNYSDTIVSITLCEDAKLLKERLGQIMKFTKKSKIMVALSTVLTVLIFSSATFIGAYATSTNIAIDTSKENSNKADTSGANNKVSSNNSNAVTSTIASENDIDARALETMQMTGRWDFVKPMFSYMSNSGIDKVVELYNTEKRGQDQPQKIASDYYIANDKSTSQPTVKVDYDTVAKETLKKTQDLNSLVGIAPYVSIEVLDEIIASHVGSNTNEFNKTYVLQQYMSTNGIDTLVKNYVDQTNDYGTVGAMLQSMSKEASNSLAKKYFEESKNNEFDWIYKPYLID